MDKAKQLEKTSPDEMPFIYETAHWDTMQRTVCSVIIATDGNLSNLTDQILISSEQEAIRQHTIEMENEKSRLNKEISVLREANDAAEAREIRHLAKIFEFNISEAIAFASEVSASYVLVPVIITPDLSCAVIPCASLSAVTVSCVKSIKTWSP